jgi:hypothetical protein
LASEKVVSLLPALAPLSPKQERLKETGVKHRLIDPDWGTEVLWSPRKKSNVEIDGKFPLWNETQKTHAWIPCPIVVPRSALQFFVSTHSRSTLAIATRLAVMETETPEFAAGLWTFAV